MSEVQDPSPLLQCDSETKEDFDKYWAENGDKIVWDDWVQLYGKYLDEDPYQSTQTISEEILDSAVNEKDHGDKNAEPSGYGLMWSNHDQPTVSDKNDVTNEKPETQGGWGDEEKLSRKNSAVWGQENEVSSWGTAPAPSESWNTTAELTSSKSDAKVKPQDVSVVEANPIKVETWGSVKASSETWGSSSEQDAKTKEPVEISSWGLTTAKTETWGAVVQAEANINESPHTVAWGTTSAKAETWGSGPSQINSWNSSVKDNVPEETKMSEDDQVRLFLPV